MVERMNRTINEDASDTNVGNMDGGLIRRRDAIDLAEEVETKRLKGEIDLTYAPMVKGLTQLPSVQPQKAQLSGESTTFNSTFDTISRQAAIDAMEGVDWYHIYNGKLVHGANSKTDIPLYKADDVYKTLNNLPSAQQEIIACGDCKHWIWHDKRCGYWNHGVKPLDWCCHAERRKDG